MQLFKEFSSLSKDIHQKVGPRFFVSVVLLFVVGLFEGSILSLMLPLIQKLVPHIGESGRLVQLGDTALLKLGVTPTAISYFILLTGILLVQHLLSRWYLKEAATVQAEYACSWQKELMGTLLHAKMSFFKYHDDAKIKAALVSAIPRLGLMAWYLIQTISSFFSIAVFVSLCLFISWKVTLLMSLMGMFLIPIIMPFIRGSSAVGEQVVEEEKRLNQWCTETLEGIKVIKSLRAELPWYQRFLNINRSLCELYGKTQYQGNYIEAIYQGLSAFMLICSLTIAIKFLQADFISVLIIMGIFTRLYSRYTALNNFIYTVKLHSANFYVLSELKQSMLDECEQIVPNQLLPRLDSIEVKQVTLQHAGKTVLDRVSLSFPKGQVIGIVGPSGSGKTSLVDALLGFNDLAGGEIYYNGQSREDFGLEAIRSAIAYVSQESILFNASFYENIALAKPGAGLADVKHAAMRANAATFIENSARGYQTQVGDRGVRLSGGQRQRIGIARALLKDVDVLIFDEATSALDSATEQEIMEVIYRLRGQMTIIIVAHRFSTVKAADYIYVLNDREVAESGNWHTLKAKRGYFEKLLKMQSEFSNEAT